MNQIPVASFLDTCQNIPAAVLGGGPSMFDDFMQVPSDAILIGVNGHAIQYGIHNNFTVFLDPISDMNLPMEQIRNKGGILISRQPESHIDLSGSDWWQPRFSGHLATWFACYLGCDPVILCGMDCYQNRPPEGQEKNNAFKDPLSAHLEGWKEAFKKCRHPERIRAVSGPLVEVFGKYPEVKKFLWECPRCGAHVYTSMHRCDVCHKEREE